MANILTLQEIEDKLDALTKQPERYIRDARGSLVEANTSRVAAVGKVTTFVDEENADPRFRYSALNTSVKSSAHKLPNIADKFRACLGAYWSDQEPAMETPSPDTNNLVYVKKEKPSIGPINLYFEDEIELGDIDKARNPQPETPPPAPPASSDPLQLSVAFTPPSDSIKLVPLPPGTTRQWIAIGAKKNRFKTMLGHYSASKFKRYIQGGKHEGKVFPGVIKMDEWFYDHAMVVNGPFEQREIERLNSELKTMYASVEPQYNFYIKSYETVMESTTSKEESFPNMYVFFAHRTAAEKYKEDKARGLQSATPPNPAFKDHITLGESMKEETSTAMSLSYDERKEFRLDDPAGQYYDIWSRQYAKAQEQGLLDETSGKFKNIFFPLGDMDLFAKTNNQQWLFPMYANIKFSTDVTTEFAEILKQTQMSSVLLSDVFETVKVTNMLRLASITGLENIRMFQAVRSSVLAKSDFDNPSGASLNITKTHYAKATRRFFNIEKWLEKFENLQPPDANEDASELFDGYDSSSSIFVGAYANEKKVTRDPQYAFWKSLMSVIFAGKLRQLIDNHQRTFKEILEGKPAYHETVCYRVAKFKGDVQGVSAEPIQNFYFPNSNEIDVLNFIDTQVKYDQVYTYIIYAYELVIGSKYKYKEVLNGSGNFAFVKVHLEPSLKMIEIPYYRKVIRMLDNPPVHPDVEFIPYRGVNNRVRIQFNGNVGKYEMHPVAINSRDDRQINKFNTAQSRLPGEKIEYESDDHPAKFQVWRTDKKPRRWTDFAGNLRKTVLTCSSTSATCIDKIRPNKKYYYAFRSIDVHGHISYPTAIYEYEMVDDAGSIYPLMRVITLDPMEPTVPEKSAKRYVRIYPSLDNTLIDSKVVDGLETGKEIATVPLGIRPEGEPAWGKKFKIRITSKNTGKKFDVNVTFKHKHKKYEDKTMKAKCGR